MKNAEFYCITYVVTAIIVLFVFRRRARRRGRRRLRHDTHQVHRRNAVRSQIAIINNARTVQITTFEMKQTIVSDNRVRLIFNGKVLQSDSSSLAQLGLQHNSTVHCLVQRDVAHPSVATGNQTVTSGKYLNIKFYCYP